MIDVVMPRLSDSMEEGTIVRWLVEDGTQVARGQEIVEIETDKATMTYEVEAEGVLRTLASEGDTLPLGALIARIGDETQPASPQPSAPAAEVATAAPHPSRAAVAAASRDARVKASPVARRIAAALGVDLAGLSATGPGGRIVKADVEAAAATAAPPAASRPAPPPEPEAPTAKGELEIQPATRIQQTIARRMAEAKATMPDFALEVEVDMDAAVSLRDGLKAAGGDDPPPSYNDMVVKAAALALREHPRANGSFRDAGFELHGRVNVGIAVAAADALLVPTVFDVDVKSLGHIARETRRLAERGRDGALMPPELAGGTFTVSNLGMYGIRSFTAVLNPPQAAILAVGALERRPVIRDGAVAAGWTMTLTLTCDHRILYGAEAAAFLAAVRDRLEHPLKLAL